MKDKIKTIHELHEASITCMNELEFIKDEQSFLEHLLSSHFLELSSEELYETTRSLIKKLKEVEHFGAQLIDDLKVFDKQIANSLEERKENNKIDLFKKLRCIQTDFESYSLKFRYVKKKLFGLIKEILLAHKQKLLIEKY